LLAQASSATTLEIELRVSERFGNFTPDVVLETKRVELTPGRNYVEVAFECKLDVAKYAFITFLKNPAVELHFTSKRVTGVLTVFNQINEAVSNYGKQEPPEDIGIDAFEFWCPQRRPQGQNVALRLGRPLSCFGAANIQNGLARPVNQPNAWVASPADPKPALHLSWPQPQNIRTIVLKFDTDFDHPMESVLMGHPERTMPFCVSEYILRDDQGRVLRQVSGNYQSINTLTFDAPIRTRSLTLEVKHPSPEVPAAVFEILCYEN
jgi:hypothetical protein